MMIWMNWEQTQEELRSRIKAQRGAQADIAKRAEVSRATVSEYVNGGRNIPVGHLSHILDVLKLDMTLTAKRDG
ncbi:helix-turn-helix domain-containing protein [Deinococcus sp. A31D244]|uniref:helix-turn-helix domain-containing protein n=1 Tax=Deinococcus sp. A31D244 TaxID=3397675 RepID=UPI0039E14A10